MPNHLINETSPYLLQHAHNPVNWYPWGEHALQKAKQENKPILVSIGYAACHWCHVMEKESFEDAETAAIMNEHFINIKIDREERPDLDHIYMDAVQAITGSGGWPLHVFLTPDSKPFYGGTYFPPQRAFNRPSWKEILISVATAFKEKRNEIDSQAENLTAHLLQANSFGMNDPHEQEGSIFHRENLHQAFAKCMEQADTVWGGFGRAPKFPQTFTIQFLLRYYYITGNKKALQQALLSLDKMIDGGIYDHVGGGFARYSTDERWLVPHFEKMLYDNALFVSVLAEAFQLTGKERYKNVIEETIVFIERELMHPQGGFCSSLDADSEGEEGRFYVWTFEEVKHILRGQSDLFCEFFNILPGGNWQDPHQPNQPKNILHIIKPASVFAAEKNISEEELEKLIQAGKQELLQQRNKRIRPALDDKILLSWNALMNTALSKAFAATGNEKYRELALKNMHFMLGQFGSGPQLFHSWKNGVVKHPAFLDDYAFLIEALIHLLEISFEQDYLLKAEKLAEKVTQDFADERSPFFFFTSCQQTDVIIRKKEVYDGATPSGNSVFMYALCRLSILLNKPEWRKRAEQAVGSLGKVIIRYPTSFGVWACLLQEMVEGTQEIVVAGKNVQELAAEILRQYIPNKVFMASNQVSDLPLLKSKPVFDRPLIYLCRNYSCEKPVATVTELIQLITSQKITE